MINSYLDIILLTLKISLLSTFLVSVFSIILVWKLNSFPKKLKNLIEMGINLSLFLSPSVLGYLLILIFGKNGVVGQFIYKYFDITIMFTWWGGVVAAFFVTLPLMYNSLKSGISSLDPVFYETALEAGASEFQILTLITLPLIKKSILAGILLTFGRAIGEFGATIMLAGNIPGKTQTISLAIYSAVESGETQRANYFLIIILIISLSVMILYNFILKERKGYEINKNN